MTVFPDDDLVEEPFEELEPCDEPSGTRTPPTPQRAMAQLLPVSVSAVI